MGKIAKRIRLRSRSFLILLLKGYKYWISPLFGIGSQCRFYPTCSAYTLEAVQSHGSCKGVLMGVKRLLKCHPWHIGGYDPVPQPRDR